MRSAGFRDVEEIDRTAEYRATLRAWYEVNDRHADEMRALISASAFEERQQERRDALAAVDDGIQRRVLIIGTAP